MGRKSKKKVSFEDAKPRDADVYSETSDSESDYIEDEEGALVTASVDAQILRTLAEIRSRDSKIYDPSVKFFDETELARAEEEWVKKEAARGEKVTLTDYQRERLLSGRLLEDEEEVDEEYYEEDRPLTHFEEQEQLKSEFKRAFTMDDEEEQEEDETGGLLVKRPRTAEQLVKEEEDYRAFLLENLSKSANARESMGDWLNYKADREGKSGKAAKRADPEESFLIDFVLNRGWVDQEKKAAIPDYEQIVNEDEEDLEAVERAEEFETAMNFRFEQPGAELITTYSRDIEGSMRREENKRKEARAAKKVRKESEAIKLKEDVKRKKNALKDSIIKKLAKIQQVADLKGKQVEELDEALDLDGSDFDLEEHDKNMAGLFGDDFYHADDTEKPSLSSDEEYDAYINEGIEPGEHDEDGQEEEEIANESCTGQAESEDKSEFDSEDEFKPKIIERPAKKGASTKEEIHKLKEELYKLDCEDIIGGVDDPDAVKCRFRYTTTIPASFGLEPREILAADETLLNQHVSLKKLAPYRPLDRQREDIKKFGDKRQVYMLKKKMWDQRIAEREEKKKRKEAKAAKKEETVAGN